jgi:hypothetical protein
MTRWLSWNLAVASILVAARAHAAELGHEGDLASVEIHGFASQGFILTSSNNYLADNTTHGSFQYSEIGLNFTKPLVDKLSLGLQLFAQDLGPTGNYDAKMDWFYLDYHWQDWLGFRAGRVKIPFGLYNEINDVDSARTAVLLPQSVYPIANVNYLLAQTGAELYGYLGLHAAGALDYHAYAGTILVDTLVPPGSPYQVVDLNVPYVTGGRLLWETPLQGLRVGGSLQVLRIDATLLANAMLVSVKIPAILWVASAEYAVHNLVFSTEYSRWYVKSDSTNATLFPASPIVASERGYAMVTYRAAPWLQPGVYYSLLFPNIDDRSGRENMQHDVATTVRFDLNSNWLVKLEGHYMSGTAGLTSSLNNDTPLNALVRNWGVFLVKTTAYF